MYLFAFWVRLIILTVWADGAGVGIITLFSRAHVCMYVCVGTCLFLSLVHTFVLTFSLSRFLALVLFPSAWSRIRWGTSSRRYLYFCIYIFVYIYIFFFLYIYIYIYNPSPLSLGPAIPAFHALKHTYILTRTLSFFLFLSFKHSLALSSSRLALPPRAYFSPPLRAARLLYAHRTRQHTRDNRPSPIKTLAYIYITTGATCYFSYVYIYIYNYFLL